jgi:hypothetical protein
MSSQCSPFDLDMNICYNSGHEKEKENEPQEMDIRGEIADCVGNAG